MPEEDLPKQPTDLLLPKKETLEKPQLKFSLLKSKFFIGFVGLSFLIAFIVGGFVLGSNNKNTDNQISNTTFPTPTHDFAAHGNIYKSTSGLFKFQYPNDWTVKSESENKIILVKNYSAQNENGNTDNYSSDINITYQITTDNLNNIFSKDYLIYSDDLNSIVSNNSSKTTLGGSEAILVTNLPGAASYDGRGIIAVHDGKVYKINLSGTTRKDYSGPKDEDGFNTIISTFKFTDVIPTPTISNNPTVCTQEAKLCPDGSYVSRTGPNCAFAACPTQ